MISLNIYGSLATCGFSPGMWFALLKWFLSRCLARSHIMVSLTNSGSLTWYGFSPKFWLKKEARKFMGNLRASGGTLPALQDADKLFIFFLSLAVNIILKYILKNEIVKLFLPSVRIFRFASIFRIDPDSR